MPMSSSSRRVTRSQTSSVLGKRPGGTLSRSSSVVSLKSSTSNALLTPDTTPDAKKPRTCSGDSEEDPSANKENIPPLKDVVMETPTARRLTRRATTAGDFVVPSLTQARRPPPRRNASLMTAAPQTPSTSFSQLTLQTPPPTPPTLLPLHVRARACLRATSNASHVNMSSDGRTKEMELIRAFLTRDDEDEDDESSKPILYISGSPGTGKTALVNTILSSLEGGSGHNVKTIFLNCMTYRNVDAVWDRIYEELLGSMKRGKRASSSKQKSSKESVLDFIERNREIKFAIILDEMDHLSSISPIALRPLFNLATQFPASIRIMGIANTHTLTSSSSSLPFDVSSSQDIETIHFSPYQPSELLAILNKRLESLPQDELKKMLPQPSLVLLTKKVGSQTGDVRVLFEVLRGAIELAAPSSSPVSPSSESPIASSPKPVIVSPKHILAALNSFTPAPTAGKTKAARSDDTNAVVSTNNEIVAKIHGLGLQQRLALLALLLATKRLTSGLPLASSAASTPASSPTKRSPMKRAQSSASLIFDTCTSGDASAGVDINVLFAFYTHLLQTADAFNTVSRSEFADLLAVLETTGLLNIQSSSSGRSFKRSSSFTSRASMSAGSGGAPSSQCARLHSDVREAEVARGMGLDADSASSSGSTSVEGIANVMQEEVRAIWMRELPRIKKEKEALARKAMVKGVDVFDDAMES